MNFLDTRIRGGRNSWSKCKLLKYVQHIGTLTGKVSRNQETDPWYSRKTSMCTLPSTFLKGHVKRSMLFITLLIFEGLLQVFWEVSGDAHSLVVVGSGFSGSGSVKHKEP